MIEVVSCFTEFMNKNKFRFKLEGKTAVFIDWANVYGWKKSLKKEIDALGEDLFV